MKFNVHATVVGSRYIGEVEAETIEEARQKAEALAEEVGVSLCHHCASEIEDPEIDFDRLTVVPLPVA